MKRRNGDIPLHFPQHIIDALSVLSEGERATIYAAFDEETKEFVGIGFTGPDGKFTKFANPEKAAAIKILEEEYLSELYGLVGGNQQWINKLLA